MILKRLIKGFPLLVLVFIFADQFIKIIIKKYLINSEYEIIKNLLSFKPYFIQKHSWFNSLFDLKIGMSVYIIFTVIVIFLSFFVYGFLKENKKAKLLVKLVFLFFYAGTICSLIDKIFWGGSLDFIYLKGFFVFDLKDIYLSLFEIILIITIIMNFKALNTFKFKRFWNYVLDRFKNGCKNPFCILNGKPIKTFLLIERIFKRKSG